LQLAETGHLPSDHADRWQREAEALRDFIDNRCFDAARGCWKRDAQSQGLDASVLLVAGMDYVDRGDPRLHATIDALRHELGTGALLYRYSGSENEEGCFLACSFWLVEALARTGRLDEAIDVMATLIGLANDVGLYSEEIDPVTSDFLGNFPQALTHLSLLNAAFALERAERKQHERRGDV
jgi:GH15 family glucan-1,4-alpha-glucosidase